MAADSRSTLRAPRLSRGALTTTGITWYRLLEDYWDGDRSTVERDFRAMKKLGANVVRVHLQVGRFMDAADRPNLANISRLGKLVQLAEEVGVYLDVTGLGSFRAADVPAWYSGLAEADRWRAQANFWEAVATICAGRPGVFAYNLMNEPLVSERKRSPGAWSHPAEMGGLRYVTWSLSIWIRRGGAVPRLPHGGFTRWWKRSGGMIGGTW